jgi:hypothetical protein
MENPDFSGKNDCGGASFTLRQPFLSIAQINHSDFWIGSGVLGQVGLPFSGSGVGFGHEDDSISDTP